MTAAEAMPYVLLGWAVTAALLVIALGANRDLAGENRALRAVSKIQRLRIRQLEATAAPITTRVRESFDRDLATIHALDEYRGGAS